MLTEDDKKWIENSISRGVVEALNELIIPQFEKVDRRFENIEQRLDRIEKRLDILEERVENLENITDRLLRTATEIQDQLDNHNERLLHLETAKV